jgi:hypothetical protein
VVTRCKQLQDPTNERTRMSRNLKKHYVLSPVSSPLLLHRFSTLAVVHLVPSSRVRCTRHGQSFPSKLKPSTCRRRLGVLIPFGGKEERFCGVHLRERPVLVVAGGNGGSGDLVSGEGGNRQILP